MKNLLLLAILATLTIAVPDTVQAAPAATTISKAGPNPNSLSRMRRRLHRQNQLRLRQRRHQ